MFTNLIGFKKGKPITLKGKPSEARKAVDAAMAAAIRRRIQDAKGSVFGKASAASAEALETERRVRQGQAGELLRAANAEASTRGAAAAGYALSDASGTMFFLSFWCLCVCVSGSS